MIGKLQKRKRIFSSELFKIGKLKGAGEPGTREWITLVAACCADGSALPPCIIYSAKSGNLQTSWLEDFKPEEHTCYFASSEKGWTNDQLGLKWLEIFDRHTKEKARGRRDWRVLILDGHGSHITLEFLNWCINHRIQVCVFPPHTTHRLQPLDIGLFRPLAGAYSTKLNLLVAATGGRLKIGKREFYALFKDAFDEAFNRNNIESAWRKSGLVPWNPEVVLGQLRKEKPRNDDSDTTSLEDSEPEPIPLNLSWRETRKAVDKAILTRGTAPVHDLIEELKARLSLAEHDLRGLKENYKLAQRRKHRGRGIIAADDAVKGNWISPRKIQQANAQYEEEQLQAEQEAFEKQQRREAAIIARQEK
jgi:hypothetical protein